MEINKGFGDPLLESAGRKIQEQRDRINQLEALLERVLVSEKRGMSLTLIVEIKKTLKDKGDR